MTTHIQHELDTIERTRQQSKYSTRRSSHLTNGTSKVSRHEQDQSSLVPVRKNFLSRSRRDRNIRPGPVQKQILVPIPVKKNFCPGPGEKKNFCPGPTLPSLKVSYHLLLIHKLIILSTMFIRQ